MFLLVKLCSQLCDIRKRNYNETLHSSLSRLEHNFQLFQSSLVQAYISTVLSPLNCLIIFPVVLNQVTYPNVIPNNLFSKTLFRWNTKIITSVYEYTLTVYHMQTYLPITLLSVPQTECVHIFRILARSFANHHQSTKRDNYTNTVFHHL